MEKPKWKKDILSGKYDGQPLDFILQESEKLLPETIIVLRKAIERSYWLIAVYAAFLTYWFNELAKGKSFEIPILMMGGAICSGCLMIRNLLPQNMILPGSKPTDLILEFYEEYSEDEKMTKYKIAKIIDNQKGITNNLSLSDKLASRLLYSPIGIFVPILLFVLKKLC